MLHGKTPRFGEEGFEVFFEINTFRVEAEFDLGFLNRPARYVNGQGFVRMTMFVKALETVLCIWTTDPRRDQRRLRKCFRDFLACPSLRRVTIRVSLPGDQIAEQDNKPTPAVAQDGDLAELDSILTIATGEYQALRRRLRAGLKFESRHQRIKDSTDAWEVSVGEAAVEEA